MNQNGFELKKNNDYFNNKIGIILEDLHDENVLTNNGVLFFIDTVFYIKDSFFSDEEHWLNLVCPPPKISNSNPLGPPSENFGQS